MCSPALASHHSRSPIQACAHRRDSLSSWPCQLPRDTELVGDKPGRDPETKERDFPHFQMGKLKLIHRFILSPNTLLKAYYVPGSVLGMGDPASVPGERWTMPGGDDTVKRPKVGRGESGRGRRGWGLISLSRRH